MARRLEKGGAAFALVTALGVAVGVHWGAGAQSDGAVIEVLDRDAAQYGACLDRAQRDPAGAREAAAQWEALGGGSRARHCAAIALIGLGAEGRAAMLLTEIGSEAADLGVEDRLSALDLAGSLWFRLGRPDAARQVYRAGVQLDGAAREPRIGLARAAAAQEDWLEAIDALAPVIAAAAASGGADPEALTLRAAAFRAGGDPQAALVDARTAVQAAPNAPLAWFEKGAAERALGQPDAARESWISASILDPDGAAGDLARLNLQRLELGEPAQ